MLFYKEYLLNNSSKIIVLDIDANNIEQFILDSVISICEGDSQTDIETIKVRLFDYLLPKDFDQRKGAIAEFYLHLFLKQLGYKQEFLFLNLEENSIKKGFDGYYTYNGREWILESKSGNNVEHKDKVQEAYLDLKGKLTKKQKNNPWQNAYNHASHFAVRADISLITKLKNMSNNYYKNVLFPLTDFNLMPCGTIFEHDASEEKTKDEIAESVKAIVNNMAGKKICAIAVSNRAYSAFLQFVGIGDDL